MKRLFLYGCGIRCNILLEHIQNTEYQVCGIVDSDPQNWGRIIKETIVLDPDVLKKEKDAYVCVTFYSSLDNETIWKDLKEQYCIGYKYQLTFHDIMIESYKNISIPSNVSDNNIQSIFLDATWGLGLGGVEAWIRDTMGYFKENGIDNVSLLTSLNNCDLNTSQYNVIDFSYENTMVFSYEYIEKGIQFIKNNLPCTLIFSRVNELLLSACLLKRKFPDKIKIVMVIHGSNNGMIRDVLSYKSFIDKYVCVSNTIKREILNICNEADKVFYMTIPIKSYNYKDKEYSNDSSKPIRIGYAGRLEVFQKKADILLKLIQALEKTSIHYEFSIAGDGSYYNKINDYVISSGKKKHVHLYGTISRERIPQFWRNQDIAINVSDHEGRPISNMEAMLYGAVPVVTETMGILDDVRNGENGIIVPINDYKTMAEKIVYLSENRDVLKSMSQKASSEIKSKISMDKYISLWKSVLYD